MKTYEEIKSELSAMTQAELYEHISKLLTKVGAINSFTGKPPTAKEIEEFYDHNHRREPKIDNRRQVIESLIDKVQFNGVSIMVLKEK